MKYLKLSEGIFMFSEGGVYKMETIPSYDRKGDYKTILFMSKGHNVPVKESIDEIYELLRIQNNP